MEDPYWAQADHDYRDLDESDANVVEVFGKKITREAARKMGAIDPATGQVYEV